MLVPDCFFDKLVGLFTFDLWVARILWSKATKGEVNAFLAIGVNHAILHSHVDLVEVLLVLHSVSLNPQEAAVVGQAQQHKQKQVGTPRHSEFTQHQSCHDPEEVSHASSRSKRHNQLLRNCLQIPDKRGFS